MAKKAAKAKSKKQPGRTIADSNRRFRYDAGGRKPLTQYPLVPITVTFPQHVREKIAEMSEQFIDPTRLKPYGMAAVGRCLVAEQEEVIDTAPRSALVEYAENNKGSAGRNSLSERIGRISLLIPKHLIDRINVRVLALNEPLIGTGTVIRWLLTRGVENVSVLQLYVHIPTEDIAYMIRQNWNVDRLLAEYASKKLPK